MGRFDLSGREMSLDDLRRILSDSLGNGYQVGHVAGNGRSLSATSQNCRHGATYITLRRNGSVKTGKSFRSPWYAFFGYVPLLWPVLAVVMVSALGESGKELHRQVDSAIEAYLARPAE